jgi:streptomycin 6-kinase
MLADSATVVSVFPNDSEVTALPMIGQPNGRPTVLKEMLPTRERLCRGAVETLAYTPERRFVAKLVGSDGSQAVVKAYSDRAYRSSFASRPSFVSRGPLRVAATLARSDRYRTVVLEWLGGRLLSEAMLDPGFDVSLAGGVGRSLAALHAQALTGRTRVTPGATLESLRAEATKMGRLCPALHARACELAEQLGACLRDRPSVYRPLHGDFHARQVVLDADAVAFLDFDGAFDGDPAFDLCSFLAGLARAVVRGSLAQRCAEHVAQALVDGYEAATGLAVQERMSLTLAVELFCLARRSFRGREPNWPEAMAAMLDRAEAATARASRPTPSDRGWTWLFDTPMKEAHG